MGDYLLQSEWMAREKTRRSLAALVHCLTYLLPFLLLTRNPYTLLVIGGTHFIIDRWHLARYVAWVKNRPWPGSAHGLLQKIDQAISEFTSGAMQHDDITMLASRRETV